MTSTPTYHRIRFWLPWVLIPLLCLTAMEWISFSNQRNETRIIENRIANANTFDTVFLGSSHTAYAVYDQGNGVCNLGAYNEPFLFSLKKLQLLKPKVVVLSVNIQNVQYNYEKIFEKGILSMPQYQYLMNTLSEEEYKDVFQLMDFETSALYKTRLFFPFVGSKLQHDDTTWLFGRWRDAGTRSELDSFRIAKRLQEEFIHTNYQPSEFQWKYLSKLCAYCQQKNIQLVFLSTPLYSGFSKSIPKQEWIRFELKLDSLISSYRIRRINFTDMELPGDHFLDSDHLNGVGAPLFTDSMLKVLRQ